MILIPLNIYFFNIFNREYFLLGFSLIISVMFYFWLKSKASILFFENEDYFLYGETAYKVRDYNYEINGQSILMSRKIDSYVVESKKIYFFSKSGLNKFYSKIMDIKKDDEIINLFEILRKQYRQEGKEDILRNKLIQDLALSRT